MVELSQPVDQGITPPYGPTKGMMQALQLMRKTTPPKIDGNFLRLNRIAPGNEYKVIGALRFLGIIDDEGRPTEKSKLLKTKGSTFTAAMQDIVRYAYRDVFESLNGTVCTQEDIYNHFVTVGSLGPEMAAKTTRFFVQLCQLAEIDLGFNTKEKHISNGSKKSANGHRQYNPGQCPVLTVTPPYQAGNSAQFPILLALTPEMAALDTDELTQFLRKLRIAYAKACEE